MQLDDELTQLYFVKNMQIKVCGLNTFYTGTISKDGKAHGIGYCIDRWGVIREGQFKESKNFGYTRLIRKNKYQVGTCDS